MQNLPKLSILLLTYKRTEMAIRTIESTCKNLKYPKELVSWFVADDGSPQKEFREIISALQRNSQVISYAHNERMRQDGDEDTFFAGMGWNKALGIAHQNSDFVLQEEDDWELDEPLDLVPYVKLLQEREDVGIVSFRILSVGNTVYTVGHEGHIYLRYERNNQYAYSGNPHLRHARMVRHYGWFSEKVNPGGIELAYDDLYRLDVKDGPQIWRPADISVWGSWKHIGSEKSWA